MNRRNFIKTGIAGVAGLSVMQTGLAYANVDFLQDRMVDTVKLGNSGLTVSRIAMGSGTKGYDRSSNQTRMGMDSFVKLAHHCYERGIRFCDTADAYGSHTFFATAIKSFPREHLTILSKLWTQEDKAEKTVSVSDSIDRFRKELGVDYLDILLMHCLMDGNWSKNRTYYMDGFSKAKQDGIVKAIGVSCHNKEALMEAAVNPWVDVIMARINPFGTLMDGEPDEIKKILATARSNGKGIIGMKIFGEGQHVKDDEREKSIRYAFKEGSVHCVTLGMESVEQIDDAIKRVMSV